MLSFCQNAERDMALMRGGCVRHFKVDFVENSRLSGSNFTFHMELEQKSLSKSPVKKDRKEC